MTFATTFAISLLLLSSASGTQELPSDLRGGGHRLGESAEQFYSGEYAGDIVAACVAHRWKAVSQMYQLIDPSSQLKAKEICAVAQRIKQQAIAGARVEYQGGGDIASQRRDTFTFDHGHLVKIVLDYGASGANVEGIHPKSYSELLAGLQQAYGDPTRSSTEDAVDTYGVRYAVRAAIWIGKDSVIRITERREAGASAEILVETLAEYKNAAAPVNPLQ
jgi:hypothetical protein